MTETRDALLAAEERLELTEQGWIEKVTYPAHANMQTRLVMHLLGLGVDPETLYWGLRLTAGPLGRWYVPDGLLVLPGNPVPVAPRQLYAGAPDLVIEILSPGPVDRERDLVEKRAWYALRGVPHYWIVDPESLDVSWLFLRPGSAPGGATYRDLWTRPLRHATLPPGFLVP